MQPHALYPKQRRRAEKHTRRDLFFCILCHSIVLGFAQQTLDLSRKRHADRKAVFFKLLDSIFSPLSLILILLLSGLFSPKSRRPEGGSGSDSCGYRSPMTFCLLFLAVFLDGCYVHSQARAAKIPASLQRNLICIQLNTELVERTPNQQVAPSCLGARTC